MESFTIPRSSKPLIARVLSLIVIGDIIFSLIFLFIVWARDVLGIDATLIGLVALLFIFKTAIVAFAVYKSMEHWLNITYYVYKDHLAVQSTTKDISSVIYRLHEVESIRVDQGYVGMKSMHYGNLVVEIKSRPANKEVILTDIKDPENVAANIERLRV